MDIQGLIATREGSSQWADKRFETADGNIVYKGYNETHKAATSDTSWIIWKLTWDGSDITRIEGPLSGSWEGRAALAWG